MVTVSYLFNDGCMFHSRRRFVLGTATEIRAYKYPKIGVLARWNGMNYKRVMCLRVAQYVPTLLRTYPSTPGRQISFQLDRSLINTCHRRAGPSHRELWRSSENMGKKWVYTDSKDKHAILVERTCTRSSCRKTEHFVDKYGLVDLFIFFFLMRRTVVYL